MQHGEQGLLGLPSSRSVNCTERCCNVPLVPYRPLLSSQLPGQTLVLLPKCPARLPCLLLLCRQPSLPLVLQILYMWIPARVPTSDLMTIMQSGRRTNSPSPCKLVVQALVRYKAKHWAAGVWPVHWFSFKLLIGNSTTHWGLP